MATGDDRRKKIEDERQQMEDAEYQRGWREGLAKGTKMSPLSTKSPMDAHDSGMNDGFNAALRGESNRYPIVTNIIFCDTRSEAETGLDRIRAHPDYHGPENWSIDDAADGEKPRYVVNYNWDMDDVTRVKWFRVAYGE